MGNILEQSLISSYHIIFGFDDDQVLPVLTKGKMLEIGCAHGEFLGKMAALAWSVEGIESSKEVGAQVFAAGFNVFCGPLESVPFPKDRFNLAVGWMVIEHLHDSSLGLRKLLSCLRPGGWLAISIPNTTNFNLLLYKDKWFALQMPNHLYHFDRGIIISLFTKSGYRVRQIFHHPSINVLSHSIQYILEDLGMPSWLASSLMALLCIYFFYPFSWLLNAFAQSNSPHYSCPKRC